MSRFLGPKILSRFLIHREKCHVYVARKNVTFMWPEKMSRSCGVKKKILSLKIMSRSCKLKKKMLKIMSRSCGAKKIFSLKIMSRSCGVKKKFAENNVTFSKNDVTFSENDVTF